jgi:hypothetical protein
MHAPPHHVAATIAIVRIVIAVGIVSVVVGPEAKPYKPTPAKSAAKSSTVESTAAKAASAKATTVEPSAASVAAAAAAASGRHGWLNDGRQCEQGYYRFPYHAPLLWNDGTPRMEHLRTGVIRQSKSICGKLTVSRG